MSRHDLKTRPAWAGNSSRRLVPAGWVRRNATCAGWLPLRMQKGVSTQALGRIVGLRRMLAQARRGPRAARSQLAEFLAQQERADDLEKLRWEIEVYIVATARNGHQASVRHFPNHPLRSLRQ